MHDRNHHHDYDDYDDAPRGAHDEPLAGCLRIRGRPMGQWRLYHHDYDDHDYDDHDYDDHDYDDYDYDDHDYDDHHHASASPVVLYDYHHDHDFSAGPADYYDRAAVLGHPGGVQRNAQGGRKSHLRVLRWTHMRSGSGGSFKEAVGGDDAGGTRVGDRQRLRKRQPRDPKQGFLSHDAVAVGQTS